MTIRSFAFEDKATGWRLEETKFGPVNLLVGPSGAGKTRILEALQTVRRAGLSGARGIGSCYWTLNIQADGHRYWWQAETEVSWVQFSPSLRTKTEPSLDSDARFLHETIRMDDDEALVERDGQFRFEGKILPQLQSSESSIELLQAEPSINPLYRALRRWIAPEMPFPPTSIIDLVSAKVARERYRSLEALQQSTEFPALAKLYLLQEDHRELFDVIRDQYCEIFPTVSELRVATYRAFDARPEWGAEYMDQHLTVGIREEGVDGWIVQDLSAGMMKVLVFLIELTLAPKGSVFLIDELENSLGVNCLPELAEYMLERSGEVQLILTSHHPQVINKIPPKYWKVVTRRGSTVKVLDASEIPALQTASPLEKFTQLINLPEFEEGIG